MKLPHAVTNNRMEYLRRFQYNKHLNHGVWSREAGEAAAPPPDFGGKVFNRVRPPPPILAGFEVKCFRAERITSIEGKFSNFR